MAHRSTIRAWALGASLAVGAMLTGPDARATTLYFSYDWAAGGSTASWYQDSNPTPAGYTGWYTDISVTDGTGSAGPHGGSSGPFAYVQFYNSAASGGFVTGLTDIYDSGPQIYSGSEADPVFAAGTYDLNEGVLTVTDAGAPAPEPAGVAIFGAALGGFVMLRRQRRIAFAAR